MSSERTQDRQSAFTYIISDDHAWHPSCDMKR